MDQEGIVEDDETEIEAAKTLEELEALRAKTPSRRQGPPTVRLRDIREYPDLMQPRAIDEGHVRALEKAIKVHRVLEPMTVVRADKRIVLIDGHHRLEAYRRAGTKQVPVRWFEGRIVDAVLEAGRANNKAKLSMADMERSEYAWRLTTLGRYSLAEVRNAAGVSDGQARKMRQTFNKLKKRGAEIPINWYRALKEVSGAGWERLDDEERERRLDAQVQDFARRMHRTFHTKLANNPELAARTLAVHFGRRLPEVVGALANLAHKEDEDHRFAELVPLVPNSVLRQVTIALAEHLEPDDIEQIRAEVEERTRMNF